MATIGYEHKSTTVVRASAVLTTSYVASTAVSCLGDRGGNQAIFGIAFTIGSLTNALVKFEWSDDNVTFFPFCTTDSNTLPATSTNESRALCRLDVLILDTTDSYSWKVACPARYVRASIKGTGTVTNSLAAITAVISAV